MGTLNVENLCGTWQLESFEQTDSSGHIVKSHPSSRGILIYTQSGAMSVSMCRVPDTDDPAIQKNFVRDIYYAGTFRIEENVIIHIAEVALHDHHRNKILPRCAHFEDEKRVLVLDALNAEGKVTGTIVWRRSCSLHFN